MSIQKLTYRKEFFHRNVDFTHIKSMKYAWTIHCHDFFEFFIILDGCMQHNINDETEELYKNDLVLIRPDDVHWFLEIEGHDCSYLNISFTEEVLKIVLFFMGNDYTVEHFKNLTAPPRCRVSDKLFTEIMDCYAEVSTQNLDSKDVQILAQILLTKIILYYIKIESNKDCPRWLMDLSQEMRKKEHFSQSVSMMSELSGKSHEHIARNFKKYFNQTPTEFINDLRLNYFANLLLMTNMSILDICFECGFSSASYAYQLFNKKYTLTPQKYRELHKLALI